MCEGGGVDDDAMMRGPAILDPCDQLALDIGLPEIDGKANRLGMRDAAVLNISQSIVTINRRLANAEHVQVRPIKYQDLGAIRHW